MFGVCLTAKVSKSCGSNCTAKHSFHTSSKIDIKGGKTIETKLNTGEVKPSWLNKENID